MIQSYKKSGEFDGDTRSGQKNGLMWGKFWKNEGDALNVGMSHQGEIRLNSNFLTLSVPLKF